jgi:hypothetical protein
MDLRDFVRASLIDIITAVQEADSEVTKVGGIVNPGLRAVAGGAHHVSSKHGLVPVHLVECDVAVTASQTEGKEAKAGIEGWATPSGSESRATPRSDAVSVSRIKSSIPVMLPTNRAQAG